MLKAINFISSIKWRLSHTHICFFSISSQSVVLPVSHLEKVEEPGSPYWLLPVLLYLMASQLPSHAVTLTSVPCWQPGQFSLAWASATLCLLSCLTSGLLLPSLSPAAASAAHTHLAFALQASHLPSTGNGLDFKINKTGTQAFTQGLSILVLASARWNSVLQMNQLHRASLQFHKHLPFQIAEETPFFLWSLS